MTPPTATVKFFGFSEFDNIFIWVWSNVTDINMNQYYSLSQSCHQPTPMLTNLTFWPSKLTCKGWSPCTLSCDWDCDPVYGGCRCGLGVAYIILFHQKSHSRRGFLPWSQCHLQYVWHYGHMMDGHWLWPQVAALNTTQLEWPPLAQAHTTLTCTVTWTRIESVLLECLRLMPFLAEFGESRTPFLVGESCIPLILFLVGESCAPFLVEFGDNLTFWSCICEYGWYWNGNSSCCSGCELRWVCSASAMVCSNSWQAITASFSGVVFEVSWDGKCSLSSEGTSRLDTSSWSVVTSTEIALFLIRWLLLVTSSSTGMLTGLCVSCWYT